MIPSMEQPYLWPAPEAVERLNQLLPLPATGREQDWEVELADAGRIGEWLDLLEEGSLDLDAQSALALLIVCSILYGEERSHATPVLDRARMAIRADPLVHARMHSYWLRFFEPGGDVEIDAENTAFLANVAYVLT